MPNPVTPQSRCRFGIATADITPPVGIYHRMWGAASHDRSEGIHRPLTATALYFGAIEEQPSVAAQQLLVAIDHCLLGVEEVTNITERAAEAAGVSREAVTVVFSHTHAAGLMNVDRSDLPGGELIRAYLEQLVDTIAELAVGAVQASCEATIVYGTARCNLAADRDYFDEDAGAFVCGFNPHRDADDTVLIARVTDDSGKVIAGIVNYACHPTTLAWENRLISPDFPGAMCELVSGAIDAPCVFLQGASGELGPVQGFVGEAEVADRNGRQLGYAVLSGWEALRPANTGYEYQGPVTSGATIGVWEHVPIDVGRQAQLRAWACDRNSVALNYRPDLRRYEEVSARRDELLAREAESRQQGDDRAAADLRALAERERRALGRLQGMPPGDQFPLQCGLWRMGDAIWVTVQGEPYSLLQQELRERFPETPILVLSIAGGWGPSYLPPREAYGKGIYQESVSWLAAGSLETLIEELTVRIRGLLG